AKSRVIPWQTRTRLRKQLQARRRSKSDRVRRGAEEGQIMGKLLEAGRQDVMQVCRNGHVVTDRLHGCPEAGRGHCDRCGAAALDRCLACGKEMAGAVSIPGLLPVGGGQPPQYCSTCGAAFPWATRRQPPEADPSFQLDKLLRRLPRVVQ